MHETVRFYDGPGSNPWQEQHLLQLLPTYKVLRDHLKFR